MLPTPPSHLRLGFATLVMILSLAGCGTRQTKTIGGYWQIDSVSSGIPEAGPQFQDLLYRRSPRVKVLVDHSVFNYRFIPPDTLIWISFSNHAMWIATGDHEPLLLQGPINHWQPVPPGDELDLGPLGKHRVADLAALAARQPPLKSTFKPVEGKDASPTTLPD